VEIVRAGAARIPDLQPLWESLSQHHAQIAPELRVLGEVRPAAESWAVRRGLYEDWLKGPDAFVLIAEVEATPVGYAVVHIRGPEETWATGDRVAQLETLAVLPGHRGQGIGSALVDRLHSELRSEGVRQLVVSVIASNADAVRFYERLGLTRFLITYAGVVPR
jgi:ribosomal protein S18 acetylase RimI-like enzyme